MKKIMIDKMAQLKRWGDYVNKLPVLEAEAEEARKMADRDDVEIVFAFYWTDEYGQKEGNTHRKVVDTLDGAFDAYMAQKDGNGSYVQGWIEIRPIGEVRKMEEIRAELHRLGKELAELENE